MYSYHEAMKQDIRDWMDEHKNELQGMDRDEQGKLGCISGYEYIGAFSPIYVEIINDGESVQLWAEI